MLDTYPVILYAMTQFTDRWFGEERAVIGRLRGVVIEKQPPEVLLEVGGLEIVQDNLLILKSAHDQPQFHLLL